MEFNTDRSNPFAAKQSYLPHAYVTFTYDAVWSMALALHKTEMELRYICMCSTCELRL